MPLGHRFTEQRRERLDHAGPHGVVLDQGGRQLEGAGPRPPRAARRCPTGPAPPGRRRAAPPWGAEPRRRGPGAGSGRDLAVGDLRQPRLAVLAGVEPVPRAQLGAGEADSRRPRRRRSGTRGPPHTRPAAPCCTPRPARTRPGAASTAAAPRSSASASIDGQMPSFQICLPSGLPRPVDHSRFRSGTLATYTWDLRQHGAHVRSAVSKSARKAGHRRHAPRRRRGRRRWPRSSPSPGPGVAAAARPSGRADRPSGPRSSRVPAVRGRRRAQQPQGERVDLGVGAGRPGDLGAVGEHRTGVEAAGDGVAHGGERAGAAVPGGSGAGRRLREAASARADGAASRRQPAVSGEGAPPRAAAAHGGAGCGGSGGCPASRVPLRAAVRSCGFRGVLASESLVFEGAPTDITTPLARLRAVALARPARGTTPDGSGKLHHVTYCPFSGD